MLPKFLVPQFRYTGGAAKKEEIYSIKEKDGLYTAGVVGTSQHLFFASSSFNIIVHHVDPSFHEGNIRGGGKIVHVVFVISAQQPAVEGVRGRAE
jgi:hypothetical protein